MRRFALLFAFSLCAGSALYAQESALSVEWESEDSLQLVLNDPAAGPKKGAIEISRDGLNPVFYREFEISPEKPLLAAKTNRFNKGSYVVKLKTRGVVYETSLLID